MEGKYDGAVGEVTPVLAVVGRKVGANATKATLDMKCSGLKAHKKLAIAVFLSNGSPASHKLLHKHIFVDGVEKCSPFTVDADPLAELHFVAYACQSDVLSGKQRIGRVMCVLRDILTSPGGRWEMPLVKSGNTTKKAKGAPVPQNRVFNRAPQPRPAPVPVISKPKVSRALRLVNGKRRLVMFVGCRDLVQRDWLSENDPLVAVFEQRINSRTGKVEAHYLDQTEWIEDTNSPCFSNPFNLRFRKGIKYKLCVYDVNSELPSYTPSVDDLLGEVQIDGDQLVDDLDNRASEEEELVFPLRHHSSVMGSKLQNSGSVLFIRSNFREPMHATSVGMMDSTTTTNGTEIRFEGDQEGGGKAKSLEGDKNQMEMTGEGSTPAGSKVVIEAYVKKQTYVEPRKGELVRPIKLRASCQNLVQKDWLCPNDPVVGLFERNPKTNHFEFVGQTEWQEQTNSPTFDKHLTFYYRPGKGQQLKLVVYDVNGLHVTSKDRIGWTLVDIDEVVKKSKETGDLHYTSLLRMDVGENGQPVQGESTITLTLPGRNTKQMLLGMNALPPENFDNIIKTAKDIYELRNSPTNKKAAKAAKRDTRGKSALAPSSAVGRGTTGGTDSQAVYSYHVYLESMAERHPKSHLRERGTVPWTEVGRKQPYDTQDDYMHLRPDRNACTVSDCTIC